MIELPLPGKQHPRLQQRALAASLLLGVVSVTAVIVAIYFGRADLTAKLELTQRQLNDVQVKAAELQRQADCSVGLEAAVDVARLDNDIAYDNYVIALGSRADFTTAQQGLVEARDALIAVRNQREKTSDACG